MVSPEKIMHLKTLISKNEINHVFNEMDAVLDALPMHHDLLVIQSNYSDLKKKEKAGALSFEHLNLGFNGIKYNLLELIEKISNLCLPNY